MSNFSLNNLNRIEMLNGDLVRSAELLPDGKFAGFRVVSGGVEIILFKDYITDAIAIKKFSAVGLKILDQFQSARIFLIRFRDLYPTLLEKSIKANQLYSETNRAIKNNNLEGSQPEL